MERLIPATDTRYRVLAALLAVALLLSGALNCFLLARTDTAEVRSTLLDDDDEAEANLTTVRAELTLTQTMLARCQAENLRRDSLRTAVHLPGH